MDAPALMWNVGQLVGFIILLRYMNIQMRDNKISLESHMKDSYTKAEVKELIDLKMAPVVVKIDQIYDDVREIKSILQGKSNVKD